MSVFNTQSPVRRVKIGASPTIERWQDNKNAAEFLDILKNKFGTDFVYPPLNEKQAFTNIKIMTTKMNDGKNSVFKGVTDQKTSTYPSFSIYVELTKKFAVNFNSQRYIGLKDYIFNIPSPEKKLWLKVDVQKYGVEIGSLIDQIDSAGDASFNNGTVPARDAEAVRLPEVAPAAAAQEAEVTPASTPLPQDPPASAVQEPTLPAFPPPEQSGTQTRGMLSRVATAVAGGATAVASSVYSAPGIVLNAFTGNQPGTAAPKVALPTPAAAAQPRAAAPVSAAAAQPRAAAAAVNAGVATKRKYNDQYRANLMQNLQTKNSVVFLTAQLYTKENKIGFYASTSSLSYSGSFYYLDAVSSTYGTENISSIDRTAFKLWTNQDDNFDIKAWVDSRTYDHSPELNAHFNRMAIYTGTKDLPQGQELTTAHLATLKSKMHEFYKYY